MSHTWNNEMFLSFNIETKAVRGIYELDIWWIDDCTFVFETIPNASKETMGIELQVWITQQVSTTKATVILLLILLSQMSHMTRILYELNGSLKILPCGKYCQRILIMIVNSKTGIYQINLIYHYFNQIWSSLILEFYITKTGIP